MMKLKILHVSNNYTPYSGGVVSSLKVLLPAQQELGHAVKLVTLDFEGRPVEDDPDYVCRIACPLRFLYKENHMALPVRSFSYLQEIAQQFNPDIIHSHHPFLLGKNALQIAQMSQVPIFFTYHSLYQAYVHYVPFPGKITSKFVNSIVNSYCKKMSGIIVPSRALADSFQLDMMQKLAVIPSAISEKFFLPTFEEKERKNYYQLLVMSRFVKEKNLQASLDLMKILDKRFKMTIAGYGAEYENLKEYAYITLQLSEDKVSFIEKPSKDIQQRLYRSADYFIFTSTVDTQGLVMAEAMASGTPVIALNGPGQRDIIKHGKNGFLCESIQEIALILNALTQKPQSSNQLQQNAWLTGKNYTAQTMAQKIVDFYTSAIQ